MKTLSSIFSMILATITVGQPATEVYLLDLDVSESSIKISNPTNISQNVGYDNQPSFSLDGNAVFFASTRDNQTDIRKYDIASGKTSWINNSSDGSEYSPTPIPNSNSVSSIQLEKNGRQLLWKYEIDDGSGSILVPYLKIGYHTWLDDQNLYAFVLGLTMTLQEINLNDQKAEIILENIGRSLHKIPGENKISFVDKNQTPWIVSSYEPEAKKFEALIPTPEGAEDMAWIPNQVILIGDGSKILFWKYGSESDWEEVIDLEQFNLQGISRIAVSPNSKRLAVVVAE